MGFLREIIECAKDISNINKEFISDVKIIVSETKRDIIQDWKKDAPTLGKMSEKFDRGITTIKNITEQIPNPKNTLRNLDKELKKSPHLANNVKNKITKVEHLKVNRTIYSHHALSLNEQEIIHYQNGIVKIDSLENFAKGAAIYIINTPRLYTINEVIDRAYSRLNEVRYNLVFNNCEHFVRWALNGEKL
ncbi:lecithin retinol acyltransferase family protein [Lysinibacillus sp. ACHW1.5]|uniref:lecithin retinol acyltransferase family protein n=1 Tax=Lysinibacillus sp. ACHW1.5 TaxID=2913506 RepID=UPI001EDBDC25|nr:lecithin retinol acyltransferase family protein [Lysinibacillus sp. ACHW1.5]UKJ44680.1 lecithin retinol acyltransferase family protein [Lysinibacillus sp. ACHW1.5]